MTDRTDEGLDAHQLSQGAHDREVASAVVRAIAAALWAASAVLVLVIFFDYGSSSDIPEQRQFPWTLLEALLPVVAAAVALEVSARRLRKA